MSILDEKLSILTQLAAEVKDLPNLAQQHSAGRPVITTFSSITALGVGDSRYPDSDGKDYTEFSINKPCVFNRKEHYSYKDKYKVTGAFALVFTGSITSGSIIDAPDADIYITGHVSSRVKIKCRNLYVNSLLDSDVDASGKVRIGEVKGGQFRCGEFYADKLKGTVYIACKKGCAYSQILPTGLIGGLLSNIQIMDASSIIGGTSNGAEANFTSKGNVYLEQYASKFTVNAPGQAVYAYTIEPGTRTDAGHIYCGDRRIGGKANVSQNTAPPPVPPTAAKKPPAKRAGKSKEEATRVIVKDSEKGKEISFPRAYLRFNPILNTLIAQAQAAGAEVDVNGKGEGEERLIVINTRRLGADNLAKAGIEASFPEQARIAEQNSRGPTPTP